MGACLAALLASNQAQAAPAAAAATVAGSPTVQTGWARPTVAGQAAGGGFVSVKGAASADRLISASSPVAQSVQLHTMEMDGSVMRMRQVPGIDVPAGQVVALQPGGSHLMFTGLKKPLKAGDSFQLVLHFQKAGDVSVQMTVSMQPPEGSAMPMNDHKP